MSATSDAEKLVVTETFESVSMDQLISERFKQCTNIKENISVLIQESIGPLQSRLTVTKSLAGKNFEKLTAAKNTIKNVQSHNMSLLDCIKDLKKQSRRVNLRIVNITEGCENGHDPVTFVLEMLLEMKGTEVFNKPPILERAHRSPGQKPADSHKQYPFVVCFHHFQVKEWLLQWARWHEMKYKINPVRIYPDLSQGNVLLIMASSLENRFSNVCKRIKYKKVCIKRDISILNVSQCACLRCSLLLFIYSDTETLSNQNKKPQIQHIEVQ